MPLNSLSFSAASPTPLVQPVLCALLVSWLNYSLFRIDVGILWATSFVIILNLPLVSLVNLILYWPCVVINRMKRPTRYTFSYVFIQKICTLTCFEQILRSSSGDYISRRTQLFLHIMQTVTSCLALTVGTVQLCQLSRPSS